MTIDPTSARQSDIPLQKSTYHVQNPLLHHRP